MSKKRREKTSQQAVAPPVSIKIILVSAVALLCVVGGTIYLFQRNSTADAAHPLPAATAAFQPTIPNPGPPPAAAPAGMLWLPGGEFSMGAADDPDMTQVGMQATQDSRPIHRVYVDGFWMDKTDVTNQQFEAFVKATGYITVAERKPRPEDYPGAPRKIW